jgi:hypothetical protein
LEHVGVTHATASMGSAVGWSIGSGRRVSLCRQEWPRLVMAKMYVGHVQLVNCHLIYGIVLGK